MKQYARKIEQLLKQRAWVVHALLGVGVVARFAIMLRGHNFDMDSWRIVADITNHHGNVYAETYRYNYGPIWFGMLHILDRLAQLFPSPYHAFRALIVAVLTLADLGIWALLKRRFGVVAAFLFFLNPIAIIITGYHNQFDTLAIVVAMTAVLLYGETGQPMTRRKWWALLLLGLSLATKHIFFFFPIWLALREKGWRSKLIALAVPVAVFVMSFLPFAAQGYHGIVANVLGYASFNNAPFWYAWVPQDVQLVLSAKLFFFGALLIGGLALRKKPLVESLLFYLIILTAFSPAIANQYLAIVCAAIAVYPNIFFAAYALVATFLLALSPAGLHVEKISALLPDALQATLNSVRAYDLPITLLAAGLFWQFYRTRIMIACQKIWQWVKREWVDQWQLWSAR